MVNHAEDKFVMFDTTFAPIINGVGAACPTVEKWICLTNKAGLPDMSVETQDYEGFIAEQSDNIVWDRFDENTACTLCYTSGTTGNPKGVLYSHRSTILHAMAGSFQDVIGGGSNDVILAVVPMFHVSAWGLVYSAAMVGAKLVMPGPGLDGANLTKMINQEAVTLMAGVPTVWLGIYNHVKSEGLSLPTVKKALEQHIALTRVMICQIMRPRFKTSYMQAVEFSVWICALSMMKEISFPKTAKPRGTSMCADHGLLPGILKALALIISQMTVGSRQVMSPRYIHADIWKSRTALKT